MDNITVKYLPSIVGGFLALLVLGISVIINIPTLDALERGLVSYLIGYFFIKLWNEIIILTKPKPEQDLVSDISGDLSLSTEELNELSKKEEREEISKDDSNVA